MAAQISFTKKGPGRCHGQYEGITQRMYENDEVRGNKTLRKIQRKKLGLEVVTKQNRI